MFKLKSILIDSHFKYFFKLSMMKCVKCEKSMFWEVINYLHINENDHIFGGRGSLDVPVIERGCTSTSANLPGLLKKKKAAWSCTVLCSILYQGLLLTSYKSILSGAFQGVAEKGRSSFTSKIGRARSVRNDTKHRVGKAPVWLLKPTWVVARDTRCTPECLPQQRWILLAVLHKDLLQSLRPV